MSQRPHRPNRQPRRGGSSNPSNPNPNTSNSSTSTHSTHYTPNQFPRPPRPPRTAYTPVPPISAIAPGTPVSIVLKKDQPTGKQVSGIVDELLTRGDHPRGVKVRLRDGRVGRVQGIVSREVGEEGEKSVGGMGAGLGRDGEDGGAGGWGDGGFGVGGEGRGRGGGRGRGRGERNGRGGRGGRGGAGRGFRGVTDIRTDGSQDYLYDEDAAPTSSRGLVDFGALEEADRRQTNRTVYAGGVQRFDSYEDDGIEGVRRGIEGLGRGSGGASGGDELKSATVHCPVCFEFKGDERAVAFHVEGHFAE